MRTRQNAVLGALLRAKRFVTEYLTQLISVVDLTVALQRLDEVISSLTTYAYNQDANKRSAKGETEKQRQVRLKLRTQQMRPIAEIARRHLRTVPDFKALQMPSRSAKGAAFIASARAMVDAALLHKDALLERGLPADSFDQFKAALTTLEESVSNWEKNHTARIGATKGLLVQEQEGRSVLTVLDALVRRALDGNEALLATWDGVRATQPRSGKTGTNPSSPATAPVTSTA